MIASEAEAVVAKARRIREIASENVPPLREEASIIGAMLQRLVVEQETLDEQGRQAKERIETLSSRIGQLGQDIDRENSLNKDAGETITTGNNNACLGYNSNTSSATVDNEIVLGGSSSQTLRCATQTISSYSDRRDKTDIVDIPIGIDFVNKLRPVKFKWDIRNVEENNPHQGTVRAGFIAQELQEVQEGNEFMDLVYAPNPDKMEAKYSNLIPVLTKAIQDLSAENTALKARLDAAGL